MILGGTNTFLGTLAIDEAKVSFSTNTNLGNAANGIVLNGGTLDLAAGSGAVTFGATRAIKLGENGGTIEVDSGSTLTDGSAIASAALPASLTKTGAGTLILTAASGYTGWHLSERWHDPGRHRERNRFQSARARLDQSFRY